MIKINPIKDNNLYDSRCNKIFYKEKGNKVKNNKFIRRRLKRGECILILTDDNIN